MIIHDGCIQFDLTDAMLYYIAVTLGQVKLIISFSSGFFQELGAGGRIFIFGYECY